MMEICAALLVTEHLLGPIPELSHLYMLALSLNPVLQGRYYYPLFTDETVGVLKGYVTSQRSHRE